MQRTAKAEATAAQVQRAALALLARREHSAQELRGKLIGKGYPAELVVSALEHLDAQGLLSDARFAEVFARSRANKGYGSVRIAQELRQRGVADAQIAPVLTEAKENWRAQITQVRNKRFGEALPQSNADRAKQARFLLQRGFTSEQVRAVLGGKLDP
ncbi:MAG: regulatory protein RecX [Gammaproteobacteria bacterium]|nr:regulatory protein RecX [Gammaproteobacteria bacterium]